MKSYLCLGVILITGFVARDAVAAPTSTSNAAAAADPPAANAMRAAAQPPLATVVTKMQEFYRKTKTLVSEFKQVYTDVLYNRRRTSTGKLYVKKPGMMRWNYKSPEKAFIADGKELWMWEPADKQAFRNPLNTDTLSTGLTFLLGSGDLAEEFEITFAEKKDLYIGGPDDLVLKLTPKAPTGQYEFLLLAIRRPDYAVTESMILTKHSRNHFLFTKLETNTKISKKRFVFKPPADTRVIDASKLRR